MANRLMRTTRVGKNCAVKIYRSPEYENYVIKTYVKGKFEGDVEESDLKAARGTAAHEARWLRKQPACRR